MKKFEKIKLFSSKDIIRELPVLIAFFVGIIFISSVVGRFSEDTSIIFNVAFGFTVTISGLCFRMSGNISEKEDKRRMTYAGERLLHASILFALGSFLKYAAIEASNSDLLANLNYIQAFVEHGLNFFVIPTFLWGLLDSHTGIKIANRILWRRLYSEEDWDSF
ncbi:MAG: hypothetical protein AAFY50_19385 [Cyanobacteria bacterium J06648_1]